MPLKDILEVVNKCLLFEGLNNRERYYMLRLFQRHVYSPGKIVIAEGDIVNELYIIAYGTWEVYLPKNEDYLYRRTDIKLQMLKDAGALLGEYSFIDHKPASASVRAMGGGELYGISRANFDQIVESSNHVGKIIYRNLLFALVDRLRKHNEDMDLMYLMDT